MTDMDMPLPTLPSMPPELMAYIDRFDGAEYGLVMIAIQRFAAAAAAKERERCAKLCEWLPIGTGLQGKTFAEAIRGEGMGGRMTDGFEAAMEQRAAAIRAGSAAP